MNRRGPSSSPLLFSCAKESASPFDQARKPEIESRLTIRGEPWPREAARHAPRGKSRRELPSPLQKRDRKSTRLNSSHTVISYAVFCLKKKKQKQEEHTITEIATDDKQ